MTLPEPVGTGPFTFSLMSAPAVGKATATLDAQTGKLVVVPAAGFSGKVALRYQVLDSSGVPSAEQEVWVDIAPDRREGHGDHEPGRGDDHRSGDPCGSGAVHVEAAHRTDG